MYGENCLGNWERWLRERRNVAQRIAKKIGRADGDLVLNFNEQVREVHEQKLMLECAQIPTDFDRYRGNPAFWHLPYHLTDHCPKYFAQSGKIQSNLPPEIEHVEVPTLIKEEKNILFHTRDLNKSWRKSPYRQEKFLQFSVKLQSIQPHKPKASGLVVKGISFLNQHPKPILTSPSTEQLPKNEPESKKNVELLPEELSLIINGENYNETNCNREKTVMKIIQFNQDLSSEIPFTTENIEFSNPTDTVLRVYFTPHKPFRMFAQMSTRASDDSSRFYFDKNELLILPKTTLNISVIFKSTKPGLFREYWEISTKPMVWPNYYHLILQFRANVDGDNVNTRIAVLSQILDEKVKCLLIRDLLEEIREEAMFTCNKPSYVDCEYDESIIFESINCDELYGKPRYFYDPKIVGEMKWIYRTTKQPHQISKWNYSIDNLTKTAKDYDIYMGRWNRPGFFTRVLELATKLEVQPMIRNKNRKKLLYCTGILSFYFQKMCEILSEIEEDMGMDFDKYYPEKTLGIVPVAQQPESHIFEYFDDSWCLKRAGLKENSKLYGERKPERLRKIPLADKVQIYESYFGIKLPKPNVKGKDKSDKSKDKTPKDKPAKDKNKKGKTGIASQTSILPSKRYDPYAEVFDETEYLGTFSKHTLHRCSREPSLSSGISHLPDKTYYRHNIYVTIYGCLAEAVDAMSEYLEGQTKCKIPEENFFQGAIFKCTEMDTMFGE